MPTGDVAGRCIGAEGSKAVAENLKPVLEEDVMLSANGYRKGLVNPGLSRWLALTTARVIQRRSALDSNHFQELAQKFGAQIDNLVRRSLELIAGGPLCWNPELHRY